MNRIGQGISIVITAYKAHNFISECLDSILCQHNIDFSKIEVLVGVDGCKETLNKLKEIKDKYNQIRLKVIYFKNNRGTYITSNTLVTLTRYNNIIRFDSDDIMYPNMINTIMSQNEHYNVIRFNYHDFFDNNINNKRLYKTVGTGVFFITKQLFMLVGGFEDWACSADAELQNRLECIQREIRLKEPLFLRRMHNDSLTMNKETGWFTEKRKEINKHIFDNVNNATLRIEMPINKNYKIMFDLKHYWDNRYKTGGNSGAGSYGEEAMKKAEYINETIRKYNIQTIQEYGCGDGGVSGNDRNADGEFLPAVHDAPSGFTYHRHCIVDWIQRTGRDPAQDGSPLSPSQLCPNVNLRDQIATWLQRQGVET